MDVDVLRPAQSQPVAAGATLGTPGCREKMPSLFVLSLYHFCFEWVLIIDNNRLYRMDKLIKVSISEDDIEPNKQRLKP